MGQAAATEVRNWGTGHVGHFPLIVRDLVAGSVQLEQTGLNLHATAGARVFISLTQLPDFITAWNYDRTRLAESLPCPLFFALACLPDHRKTSNILPAVPNKHRIAATLFFFFMREGRGGDIEGSLIVLTLGGQWGLEAATSACMQQVSSTEKLMPPNRSLCLQYASRPACHYHRTSTLFSCRSHNGAVKAFTTQLVILYGIICVVSQYTTRWKAFLSFSRDLLVALCRQAYRCTGLKCLQLPAMY